MPQKIIIIRGNSGSGKSTIAGRVRERLGAKTMFLQQDVLRRDILKVEDKAGNPVIGLIEQMAMYGKANGYNVLLEGILSKNKYGAMLTKLLGEFDESYVYYLDITFEETLRRHSLRPQNSDFGEAEMREWWKEKDYLLTKNEKIITDDMSEDEIVDMICGDVSQN